MDEDILMKGKKFLVSYLRDKDIGYETIHPWRRNWEFIVLHSFRVEGYVMRLIAGEVQALFHEEILTTRLAAVLHDIGKIHDRKEHALKGRDIVSAWLRENPTLFNGIMDTGRLLYLIEKHSDKEDDEADYCLKLLRDADILDEIGVISVFMTSNWIERSSPYFFELLSDRVENFEIGFCDDGFKLLNTATAKYILSEKKRFIELFSRQLKDELNGTEIFGKVGIEDIFGESKIK